MKPSSVFKFTWFSKHDFVIYFHNHASLLIWNSNHTILISLLFTFKLYNFCDCLHSKSYVVYYSLHLEPYFYIVYIQIIKIFIIVYLINYKICTWLYLNLRKILLELVLFDIVGKQKHSLLSLYIVYTFIRCRLL